MKGKLRVESQFGRGSKFSFTARMGLKDTSSLEEEMNASYQDKLAGRKILVVDDNVTNRTVAKKILERIGIQVTLAESGGECLASFQAEEFDMILMDIQMPGMSGLEVTEQIRMVKNNRKLPIIAVSGNTQESDIKKSKAAGMNAHIGKPINSQLLYQTMVECLQNI